MRASSRSRPVSRTRSGCVWQPRFPELGTLVGDAQREFWFTTIFADLELAPRARDLEAIMSAWQPDLVVHEVAELAAPLVSTSLGIPYVDVGFGSLIPRRLLEAAGAAARPHWTARGLEPGPVAGLFRYLYVDPCPPTLQQAEIDALPWVQRVRPQAAEIAPAGRPEILTTLPHRHDRVRHPGHDLEHPHRGVPHRARGAA